MAARPPAPPSIPTLVTGRLTLRGHTLDDFSDSCTLWAEPDVTRFTVGRPQTEEEVWSRLLRYAGSWALLGYGYWVVRETATGAFVGEVGLCNYHRQIEPPIGDIPEIGWCLLPKFHGKGYATEAAQAVLEWAAEGPLRTRHIACIILDGNSDSFKVAGKCGLSPAYVADYRGHPTHVLFTRSAAPQTP